MSAIGLSISKLDPKEAADMTKLLQNFKHIVEQDDPKALTLEQVYERWNGRKTAGDTLEIAEVSHDGFRSTHTSCILSLL